MSMFGRCKIRVKCSQTQIFIQYYILYNIDKMFQSQLVN